MLKLDLNIHKKIEDLSKTLERLRKERREMEKEDPAVRARGNSTRIATLDNQIETFCFTIDTLRQVLRDS